jgi:ATP-dependent Lon protease
MLRLPDGSTSVLVQGRARVQVVAWTQATPHFRAKFRLIHEPPAQSQATEALMRAVLALFERVVALNQNIPEEAFVYAMNVNEPGWLADLIAQALPIGMADRQSVLETIDPNARLQKMSTILARELDVLELEDRIQANAQNEVDKSQREYYLREQLRAIQTELGESDGSLRDTNSLRERLSAKPMPDAVREKANEELTRLAQMPMMAPDAGVVRGYIEWLLDLPWSEETADNLDVRHAERVLNERHFGLPKAKDRILEYIAVRKLTQQHGKTMRSPIICFVGPPGTGKTSLARSIADALERKFVRMSVGGVRDEAEIRGHRRTYVGALPGRILQTMKRAGTVNPLFVLDEIDKLGEDFRGDPSAALLEVLDPEQNFEFEDHYLALPYDLSKVLWVTTANTLDGLPPALVDRMEVIEFPGYVEEEKLEIARRYLVPRQISENGLLRSQLVFSDEAVKRIIREYTYEAGVRELDRRIGMVCRKTARNIAESKKHALRVNPDQLHKFLGPPPYDFGKMDETDQVGVANGVSWSEGGGDLLPIEVTLVEGKGNLTLTGSLGDVMQESAQAALSYARARAKDFGIVPKVFEKNDIHIHVAEGAIPKDGPSAGITMATALISALTKTPVRRDVAMTGEITLRGRVLPIGGLKEKLLAAHRAGLRTLVLPKKNAKDLEEVPKKVQREMTLVQVASMDEVVKTAMTRALKPLPKAKKKARRLVKRVKSKVGRKRANTKS